MPALLVLLFVGVPLLEIAVILQVGAAIGGWPTAGILVLDSVVGAWLLRVEGSRAWLEFRRALAEGRWPGDEVAQGALVIVGGTLLVTPGFVTDVVGFAFLLGPTRRLVARAVRSRVREQVVGGAGIGPGGEAADGRVADLWLGAPGGGP
ncbi:MAG: FxsA family protein [Nitriliruptoraceae bacterium]